MSSPSLASPPVSRFNLIRRGLYFGCAAGAVLCAAMQPGSAQAQAFRADPFVVAGDATFERSPAGQETITVVSPSAVINWTPNVPHGDTYVFLPAGNIATFQGAQDFAVLNRILPRTPATVIMDGTVLGRLAGANTPTTNGIVAFFTPTGLLIGSNALFDVGSLILTTLDPLFTPSGEFIDATGAINFQPNTAFPTSSVTTLLGSRITAAQEDSFVIMAAPQVVHGGSVRVNGSSAYVAASSAVIRYNGGLFDIFVTGGTPVGTPLTHTGSTTGPASTGAADPHNIYMASVSENMAITALVGGTVGYDAPLSATVENGAIILYTFSFGAQPTDPEQANLEIVDGTFTSDVTALSSHNVRATGTIDFQQDLLMGGTASARVSAPGAGEVVHVGGNLTMTSTLPVETFIGSDRTGGDIRIVADNGGRVQVDGNATLDASAVGRLNPDTGAVGTGTGGLAAVDADNGNVSVAGNLVLRANGQTQTLAAAPNVSGAGIGGTTRVAASNAGVITVNGSLGATAFGVAGATTGANPVAPDGTGGSATISAASGGIVTVAGPSQVQVGGVGGLVQGNGRTGGTGTGGTVRIEAAGGQVTLSGAVNATANGFGGAAPSGGTGIGGDVTVQASDGGRVRLSGPALFDTTGLGAAAFQPGGTGGGGTGGTVAVRALGGAAGGSLELANLTLFAAGAGGAGGAGLGGPPAVPPGAGGAGAGGSIEATADADSGVLSAGQLRADARGLGGAGGAAAGAGSTPGAGGAASGGIVQAGVRSGAGAGSAGSATFVRVDLIASGAGGNGGIAGAGTGGSASLRSTGGTGVTVTGPALLTASGTGGVGVTGGTGQGGTAEVDASGGIITIGNGVGLDARGFGGNVTDTGTTAGSATGGTARLRAGAATQIRVTGSADLNAAGLGGAAVSATSVPGQTAGSGTGGTSAILTLGGGSLSVTGGATVNAEGAGGIAATAGAGTGGTARVDASGPGGNISLGNANVNANGTAALLGAGTASVSGGNATGGNATIVAGPGSTIGLGNVAVPGFAPPLSALVSAQARSGVSFSSGSGSNAQGGTAIVSAAGGTINAALGVAVSSVAFAGNGQGNAGGGTATGGTSSLLASGGGTVTVVGNINVSAAAVGGSGAGTGAGGDAQGGTARLSAPGGAINIQGSAQSAVDSRGVAGGGVAGGAGRGGTSELSASGGTGSVVVAGTARLDSNGFGSAGTATGGPGRGGSVQLSANSSILLGALNATAEGFGGGGPQGGDAQGGSVAVLAGPASSIEAGAAGANVLSARALAGQGAAPGNATGGTINAVVAATGRLALTGAGTSLVTSADAGSAAGTGNAGNITLQSDGTTDVTSLTARADVNVGQGNGGNVAIGGAGTVNYQSATVSALGTGANPQAGGVQLRNMTGAPGSSTLAANTSGPLSATNVSAGQSITLTTPRLATLAGTVAAPNIQVASSDIVIQAGATVGAPGANVGLTVQPTGTQTVIGGVAPGPGYTLDSAEVARIRGASLTVSAPANGASPSRAPDVLVRDAAIDGTRLTSLTLSTPGIVEVAGALQMANAGAANRIAISGGNAGAERVQLVTPAGGVRIRDAAGAPAGSVDIAARDIWVGDRAMLDMLIANRNFAGRDAALLAPASVPGPRGAIEGSDVVLRPGSSLLVQNSGTLFEFGGITVGNSLTISAGTAAAPADVYAFGRRLRPDGTANAGTPFFFQVDYQGSYTDESAFNTCIINTRTCPGGPNVPTVPGTDLEEPVRDPSRPFPSLFGADELIERIGLSEPLIEEPVTSGGDSSAWTGERADECAGEDPDGTDPNDPLVCPRPTVEPDQ